MRPAGVPQAAWHVAASIVMLLPEILKHAPFATILRKIFLVENDF